MGVTSPPPTRRSQQLILAMAEFGQEETGSRLAPISPCSSLVHPRNPPQRPFVTDLRLSPAQRSRSNYSPHWLEQVEAPGCGLCPEDAFLMVTGYKHSPPSSSLRRPSPTGAKTDAVTNPKVSRSLDEDGIRKATHATKAIKESQSKSRIHHERKALPARTTHDYQQYVPAFDHGTGDAPKMRYMDRVKKFHTFDGRLIQSRVTKQ